MVLIVVLAAAATFVWFNVLGSADPEEALGCPPAVAAPGAPAPGEVLPPTALDGVAPAPPQAVNVQVLNANGERGEAAVVTAGLTDLGLVPAAEPANDPLYPAFDLTCHGQIRYGDAGAAAARTLSLVVPCADLVRDARPEAVVDLALGTEFTELAPSEPARTVLMRLAQPAPPPVAPSGENGNGGDEEETESPAAAPPPPTVDPGLLAAARDANCEAANA